MNLNFKILIIIIEIQYLLISEIKMEKNNKQNNHCQPLQIILKINSDQLGNSVDKLKHKV